MMFKWLSLITGILYVVLGLAILGYKFFFVQLDPTIAYAFGPLLIVYGIFRTWRGIINLKNANDED